MWFIFLSHSVTLLSKMRVADFVNGNFISKSQCAFYDKAPFLNLNH